MLSKLKVALLVRAGLAPRTEAPSQWEAEEQPIVPGPNGVVDPKKVVLHKMVARGMMFSSVLAQAAGVACASLCACVPFARTDIFYSSLANDAILPLEAFSEPEVQRTIAFLRAALVVPDDSYRHWLSQRSMMHYYTDAPAVAGFAAAPPMEV